MKSVLPFLPSILLIVIYILILFRKGEANKLKESYKNHDWLTFLGALFAATQLSETLQTFEINIPTWLIYLLLISFVVLIIVVVLLRVRAGKPIIKRVADERTNAIYAKSSRNTLFATYLTFFIHSIISDSGSLDAWWVMITLISGLSVLMVSLAYYSYWKT